MGNSDSKSNTQKIITEITQRYHLENWNSMTTDQRNDVKAEMIANYIQNMTARNINRSSYETNLETVANDNAKAMGSNEIIVQAIEWDQVSNVDISQVNEQCSSMTSKIINLFNAANQILASATSDEITQAAMNGALDTETLNETMQENISNIISNNDTSNDQSFQQQLDKDIPDIDISLISLPDSLWSSTDEENEIDSTTKIETDTEQINKNMQAYLLSNNQEFVNHMNACVDKLLENISESNTTISNVAEQAIEAITEGTNKIVVDGTWKMTNTKDVKIFQSNELRADAAAEMVINSLFDQSQTTTQSATMADMLDMGSSVSGSMGNFSEQSSSSSSSLSNSISNALKSSQVQTVIGAVIVVIVIIIGLIIFFKLRNQKEKERLDHGYAPSSQMMMNTVGTIANNSIMSARNPFYKAQSIQQLKPGNVTASIKNQVNASTSSTQ